MLCKNITWLVYNKVIRLIWCVLEHSQADRHICQMPFFLYQGRPLARRYNIQLHEILVYIQDSIMHHPIHNSYLIHIKFCYHYDYMLKSRSYTYLCPNKHTLRLFHMNQPSSLCHHHAFHQDKITYLVQLAVQPMWLCRVYQQLRLKQTRQALLQRYPKNLCYFKSSKCPQE